MRKYLMGFLAVLALTACDTRPQSPAQDVYFAESAYAVALKIEIKYCSPVPMPAICPQVRKADDVAWSAIREAQTAVRTPGFGESKIKTAVASAMALTKAFSSIAAILEE